MRWTNEKEKRREHRRKCKTEISICRWDANNDKTGILNMPCLLNEAWHMCYNTSNLSSASTHACIFFIQYKLGVFQWIINCQSIQAPLGIRSSPYPRFCLIAVKPEEVAIIVINVDAIMYRIIFCGYQFHCYQSFRLNRR